MRKAHTTIFRRTNLSKKSIVFQKSRWFPCVYRAKLQGMFYGGRNGKATAIQ